MHLHMMHLQLMWPQHMQAPASIDHTMARATTRSDTVLVDEWHGLLAAHARAHCALERALKPHDLGISEFEVLERLAAGATEHLRMQELGQAVHLSQSALSRVVGRLEADGLATRGMCPEDRRGIYVGITDAGRERYETARPSHRAALAETLG